MPALPQGRSCLLFRLGARPSHGETVKTVVDENKRTNEKENRHNCAHGRFEGGCAFFYERDMSDAHDLIHISHPYICLFST